MSGSGGGGVFGSIQQARLVRLAMMFTPSIIIEETVFSIRVSDHQPCCYREFCHQNIWGADTTLL
jgi:hypothetical protein